MEVSTEELISDLSTLLDRVPASASDYYEANEDELCCLVDQWTAEDPEMKSLLGANGLDVAFDNDRNHVKFMSNVFGLKRAELLVGTVPWVYRSYHARGFSHAYFPRVLQYWMNAVQQTLLPEFANPINAVYRWMLQHHEQWVQLSEVPATEAISPSNKWGEIQKQFFLLLVKGAQVDSLHLAEANVKTLADLRGFYSHVITPTLYEVGRCWEIGEISVAEEHRASAIARRVIDALYRLMIPFRNTKGLAIIAAATNEWHDLGARLLADLMEAEGWDVDFLGANMPDQDVLKLIRLSRPHVLGISVAMPFNLKHAKRVIEMVRQESGVGGLKVLVGGQAFRNDSTLWRTLGADGHSPDAEGAIRILEEWWQEMAPLETGSIVDPGSQR